MSGGCNNISLYQKCMRALLQHTTDVQFIFENGNDVVKIPANKVALAALSPVFNAMFNGELKEKGDVKITDASPEAFQEFLQFFSDSRVNLTTKNIAEVLKLVDKYDIADALPLCSDFLKNDLKIDEVLWKLHLAIQFNLDDLKTFCEQTISRNHKRVFDMINVEGGRLRVASDSRLSDVEMANIIPHVFAISKNIISKLSEKSDFLSVTLASTELENIDNNVDHVKIKFSLDKSMVLAGITFSGVYRSNPNLGYYGYGGYDSTSWSFDMYIDEICEKLLDEVFYADGHAKILRHQKIVIDSNENGCSQVELQPPISIQPDHIYTITLKSATNLNNMVTQKLIVVNTSIQISPNVYFTTHLNDQNRAHSLISQLRFKQN